MFHRTLHSHKVHVKRREKLQGLLVATRKVDLKSENRCFLYITQGSSGCLIHSFLMKPVSKSRSRSKVWVSLDVVCSQKRIRDARRRWGMTVYAPFCLSRLQHDTAKQSRMCKSILWVGQNVFAEIGAGSSIVRRTWMQIQKYPTGRQLRETWLIVVEMPFFHNTETILYASLITKCLFHCPLKQASENAFQVTTSQTRLPVMIGDQPWNWPNSCSLFIRPKDTR